MFGALPAEVYGAGLVFCRVGALVMLIPGLGDAAVPPRVRLAFALLLTLVLFPLLRNSLPPEPATVGGLGAECCTVHKFDRPGWQARGCTLGFKDAHSYSMVDRLTRRSGELFKFGKG